MGTNTIFFKYKDKKNLPVKVGQYRYLHVLQTRSLQPVCVQILSINLVTFTLAEYVKSKTISIHGFNYKHH